MFWADEVVEYLRTRHLASEWVDDMKTPSGKIHVGALRGVVIHDLVYRALRDAGVPAIYTYIFDDHDPMDALPVYLAESEFGQYLGQPLFTVPSPSPNFSDYAQYYAQDFIEVFEAIGCHPEVLWASELYRSGSMNEIIAEVLDQAAEVRQIYSEMYGKPMADDWYPFQPYCPVCGKVSTTETNGWNGTEVSMYCRPEKVKFTRGCGYRGWLSPFSDAAHIAGKLPWKLEWPAKWKMLGVTVEGAGKDHMSAGGSHDLAIQISERVLHSEVPYPLPYEFFLVGGKKMSSSRGLGSSAQEMLEILPPEILRFLMVRTRLNSTIDFEPEGETIPRLFDDYQRCARAYYEGASTPPEKDFARIFELSALERPVPPPTVRFSTLCQWVQMPDMTAEIAAAEAEVWAPYARVWLERFAAEEDRFTISEDLPVGVTDLSGTQKDFLGHLAAVLEDLPTTLEPEIFQSQIYDLGKVAGLNGKQTFSAIYLSLLDKDHGPKAAWLLLSLERNFLVNRFRDAGR